MNEFKICPTCNEKHNKANSAYCCKNIDKECPVCKKTFKTKCNKSEKMFCDRYCQIGAASANKTGGKPVRAKAKEKSEPEIKHCINCNVEITGKGDYCYKKVEKECAYCGDIIAQTCAKVMKNYCGRKCSASHKKNECLRCGHPAKEKYCGEKIIIHCKTCGKEKIVSCTKDMSKYCDTKCALQDPEVKERIRNTQIERYGAFGFNTEKQKKTMIEKYGYETPAKNEEVKKRSKEKQFKNNGGIWAFNTQKQKETMLNKYGKLESEDNLWDARKDEYNNKKNKNYRISKINIDVANKIKAEFNLDVVFEFRIDNYIYDLYIESLSLLIDINPTVSHNSDISYLCTIGSCSLPCNKHSAHSKYYHQKRSENAIKNNFNYIQKFENKEDSELLVEIGEFINRIKLGEVLLLEDTIMIDEEIVGKFNKNNNCLSLHNGTDIRILNDIINLIFSKGFYTVKIDLNIVTKELICILNAYDYKILEPYHLNLPMKKGSILNNYRVFQAGLVAIDISCKLV